MGSKFAFVNMWFRNDNELKLVFGSSTIRLSLQKIAW